MFGLVLLADGAIGSTLLRSGKYAATLMGSVFRAVEGLIDLVWARDEAINGSDGISWSQVQDSLAIVRHPGVVCLPSRLANDRKDDASIIPAYPRYCGGASADCWGYFC